MGEVSINKRDTGNKQRGISGGRYATETEHEDTGYFMVQRQDGALRCSCGRELIKHDENSLKCSAGYPIYRPQDGDMVKDKFGEISLRMKPHKEDEK